DFINLKISLPIYGDDPRDINELKLFSASPIYNDENLQGYVYVIIGGETYDSIFEAVLSDQHLWQSLVFLLG
ncbi:sensor histidine kinase, partial [Psychromonas arctica]